MSSPISPVCASPELWASHVASHADLPDERLNTRLGLILTAMAALPQDSIPQASGSSGQAKAMYRFFANERFGADDLLQPLIDATTDSCRGLEMLIAVQDTSSLNYSSLKCTTGLGPVNHSDKARGLHMHTVLGLRQDGVPLGLLDQSYWARTPGEHTAEKRRERPIEEKESRKWLDGIEAAEAAWEALPAEQRPRLIHVMDREGDIHEVLQRISDSPHDAVIRCAQNRSVAGEINKVYAALDAAPVIGITTMDVPRGQSPSGSGVSAKRTATLVLRSVSLTLTPDPSKYPQRRPVTWTLVEAREENAPADVEPLHWRLWTRLPATTHEEILEVLRIYGLRWRVEDFHLTMKSGCQVERLELETAERLVKALTLYAAVAVRIVAMRDLARVEPTAPCTLILSDDAWQALWLRFAKTKLTATTLPPTIKQAVQWIGRLGGHLNRKRDGMPGVRVLWRGFRDLTLLLAGYRYGRAQR